MRVLIIEEKQLLARDIYEHITQQHFLCDVAYNIFEGKRLIKNFYYDCVILGADLTKQANSKFLKEINAIHKTSGIIIISEINIVKVKIAALNLGADDYLIKPMHLDELCARVNAIVRRRFSDGDNKLVFNELIIDTFKTSVMVGNTEVKLTTAEYEILQLLIVGKGRIVSKEEIAKHLTGQMEIFLYNFDTLYTHIKNLKKKLLSAGKYIKTIYGAGYRIAN